MKTMKEKEVDIKKIIKDLGKDFGGSNEDQMAGIQLLKGLATSDNELANTFMKKLDQATTKISKELTKNESMEKDFIEVKKEIQIGDIILEKGDKIRVIEGNRIEEKGPISKEGALKFVFKLPKEGKFTAEFLDGSSATIDVDPDDKSSNSYAFIGKDSGKIFQTWDSKPSKDDAHKVLQRVKSF